MKKWEYKFVQIKDVYKFEELKKKATMLGSKGWELVNAPHWDSWVGFIFKREI